jgi:hypothetical protein
MNLKYVDYIVSKKCWLYVIILFIIYFHPFTLLFNKIYLLLHECVIYFVEIPHDWPHGLKQNVSPIIGVNPNSSYVGIKTNKNIIVVASYSWKSILVSTIFLSHEIGSVKIEQHIMDFVGNHCLLVVKCRY